MFPCPRPEKSTANACPCSLAVFLQALASSNLQYNLYSAGIQIRHRLLQRSPRLLFEWPVKTASRLISRLKCHGVQGRPCGYKIVRY